MRQLIQKDVNSSKNLKTNQIKKNKHRICSYESYSHNSSQRNSSQQQNLNTKIIKYSSIQISSDKQSQPNEICSPKTESSTKASRSGVDNSNWVQSIPIYAKDLKYICRFSIENIINLTLIDPTDFDLKLLELLKNKLTKCKSKTQQFQSSLKNQEKIKRIIRFFKNYVKNNQTHQLDEKEKQLIFGIEVDKFNETQQCRIFSNIKIVKMLQKNFCLFYKDCLRQNLKKSIKIERQITQMLLTQDYNQLKTLGAAAFPLLFDSIQELKQFFKKKFLHKIKKIA